MALASASLPWVLKGPERSGTPNRVMGRGNSSLRGFGAWGRDEANGLGGVHSHDRDPRAALLAPALGCDIRPPDEQNSLGLDGD